MVDEMELQPCPKCGLRTLQVFGEIVQCYNCGFNGDEEK